MAHGAATRDAFAIIDMSLEPDIFPTCLAELRVEEQIELARWSTGNALLIGSALTIVGLYVVAWLYRREARGTLTRARRWMLVAFRVATLLLLGLIGLEPVLVKFIYHRRHASTLVLVDESASMGLDDPYRHEPDAARVRLVTDFPEEGGLARNRLVQTILNERPADADRTALLDQLAAHNSVRVFGFSNAVAERLVIPSRETTTQPAATPRYDAQPGGSASDLGAAVRGALDAVGGNPVSAIVLLSDGAFNRGESASVIGRLLNQRNVPLYAVGVGDPAEPVNIAVTEVSGPRSAYKNDPFTVTVRLDATGIAGETVTVELVERHEDGGTGEVVERRTATIGRDGAPEPVVFERKVEKPGAVRFTARVAPLDHEAVALDNQRDMLPPVQILDDQMRVLLIAGAPSYDYRYLARLLERDATVDLSTWLQSADLEAVRDGNTVITELPDEPDELFAYDAILLLDPDPSEFDPTWASLVATQITDRGGGLLYAAGNKYAGRFFGNTKTTPLVELLPILPDPDAEIRLNDLGQYQKQAWPIRIPDDAIGNPTLRQADDAHENRAVWAALEGVYWHYPVRREKPLAGVLMRHSNPAMSNAFGPHVLYATQFVGAGRTAFLGFDSTWRWRRGTEAWFNRFWIQTLRYLVEGKLLGGRARGLILTEKEAYETGDSVVVTVRALDDRFQPLLLPELDLWVEPTGATEDETRSDDGERVVQLSPMLGREGYYQGRFVAREAGALQLRLRLPDAREAVLKEIAVARPNLEMRDTAMHRDLLRDLAEASGGRYLEIDEAGMLGELIPDRSTTIRIRERPRPLWDNRYVLMLLVGLLTIEWILRKRARLL